MLERVFCTIFENKSELGSHHSSAVQEREYGVYTGLVWTLLSSPGQPRTHREITCLLECKHSFVLTFLSMTSLYNINLFHIKCDISSNKRVSKVDLRSELVLRGDTLSTGLDSSLVLLWANIVLHSKRFTGYIGFWHWVSSCFTNFKLVRREVFLEAELELVEVPVVVEDEALPLVLTAEVQLARPFWLVVLGF